MQFTFAAVEDVPGQAVALFLQVPHALEVSAVAGVVGEGQHVQGFENAPVVRDRLTQVGEPPVVLQDPDHVVRGDLPRVHRRDHPQNVGPVPTNLVQIDPVGVVAVPTIVASRRSACRR